MVRAVSFVAAIALVGLACTTAISVAGAQQEQPAPNPFGGKSVVIYTSDGSGHGYILKDARLVTVGNRVMLSGIGAGSGDPQDWTKDLPISIAWDVVSSYVLLDAEKLEEFRKQYKNRPNPLS